MFRFIKNIFLKGKIRRVAEYCDNIDSAFASFEKIGYATKEIESAVKVLSKDDFYSDLVSRYNVCIQKIEIHNSEIQQLTFAFNSLMSNYSKEIILNNVLEYSQEKISEIYATVKKVYWYNIPKSFKQKAQYDRYKHDIEEIADNLEIIKQQKRAIIEIYNEIENLPDVYISEDNAESTLGCVSKLLSKYNKQEKLYFNPPSLDDKTIDRHNAAFITRHLRDHLFDNINGKSLDDEQRSAILCDAKSNLTIAGAGSGKTLTICGKVKYILETGLAKENEILLLSYSKASAEDLDAKVNKVAKGLTVETFHALGLKILTEHNGKKKAIEDQLKVYIKQFFEEEFVKNPNLANETFQYISLYFYAAPINKKKYKNDGEIFQDLKTAEYKTLKDRLGKLSENKERHETLKKELVKSNEELVIANYLFINGVNYEYEKPYEETTGTLNKRQYTPDFYLPDYKIYLEHYGIDSQGRAPQYDEDAENEYIASMFWKRQTHAKYGTKCIETYSYEFSDGSIFDKLQDRLIENGVELKPLSQIEVFNALHNVYKERDFTSFLNLITTFISLYKAQMKDNSGFDQLKSQLSDSSYDTSRTLLFLNICKSVYDYYTQNLRESDKIDFDDMILQTIDLLDSTDSFKYKYIIVDEFQDISQSRTRFLQKLIEHGNSKLFAVGDDWQAIYRFAGCDINVFLEFDKIFKGAKLNYITSTHRNSSELQKIVEPFITANPSQYKKHIRSKKHQDNPIRIVYHKGNKAMALTKALEDICKINSNASVLILGRNRHDIDPFACRDIRIYNYKTIEHRDYPFMKLTYSTIHGAKGLECDFVILISGEDAKNGFPNKMEDDNVLTLLLGKDHSYAYSEERRLFYVALTRTKSIVYLLSEKAKSSEFIQEISKDCYILNDETSSKAETEYLCPWCKSGHLIVRTTNEEGSPFYGCSNFPYCTYTNNDMKSVYFNNRCPVCGDFLVLRNGKYGNFFGCHNFPRCRYTQQNIEKQTE